MLQHHSPQMSRSVLGCTVLLSSFVARPDTLALCVSNKWICFPLGEPLHLRIYLIDGDKWLYQIRNPFYLFTGFQHALCVLDHVTIIF